MAARVASPLGDVSFAVNTFRQTLAQNFNPSTDLCKLREPPRAWSLEELGYEQGSACSAFGVCEPFQLLQPGLVARLKLELMTDTVRQNCRFSTSRTPCCLRGVAEQSQLVNQLWSSSEITQQVSELAGIPLKPICDYEKASATSRCHPQETRRRTLMTGIQIPTHLWPSFSSATPLLEVKPAA